MSCCSKTKVFEKRNGKVLHEFNCSNCSGYITVKLDEDLNGAHCVVCPSCQHEHYRIIKDGCITEDRAPSSSKTYAIKIKPTMAAFSKTSWESKLANRKTNVKDDGGKHMLGDLWKSVVNKQKQTPPADICIEPVKKPEPCIKEADLKEVKQYEDKIKKEEKKEKKVEPLPPQSKPIALEELIHFAKKNKEAAISLENYEDAICWRDFEKEFITRRGK